MMRKILIYMVLFLLSAYAVYAGMHLGMTGAVKARVQALDAKVQAQGGEPAVAEGIISGPGTATSSQMFRSLTVSPSDPDVVFVGTEGNGIFKSTDGGDTWNWYRTGLLYSTSVLEYGEAFDIAIAPSNEDIVYCAMAPSGLREPAGNNKNGVYQSVNGGSIWNYKLGDMPTAGASCIAVDPLDPAIVYHASGYNTNGGIYKSINFGDNWTRIPMSTQAYTATYNQFLVLDSQTMFTCGVADDWGDPSLGLVRTTDGGANWTNIDPPGIVLGFFDVSPQDHNYIYASEAHNYKIHTSTNGGSTWRSILTGSMSYLKVSPHDKNTVIYSRSDKLYKSTGSLVTVGYKVADLADNLQDIEFSKSDSNVVYIGLSGYKLYKSTDAGESFSFKANLRDYIDTH